MMTWYFIAQLLGLLALIGSVVAAHRLTDKWEREEEARKRITPHILAAMALETLKERLVVNGIYSSSLGASSMGGLTNKAFRQQPTEDTIVISKPPRYQQDLDEDIQRKRRADEQRRQDDDYRRQQEQQWLTQSIVASVATSTDYSSSCHNTSFDSSSSCSCDTGSFSPGSCD